MPTRQRGDNPAPTHFISYLAEVRALQAAQRKESEPTSEQLPERIPPARAGFLTPGGLYAPAYTLDGKQAHAKECAASFGRHDLRCRRCLELLRGAAPRTANFIAAADSRQRRLF